jgi:hypothetical protein
MSDQPQESPWKARERWAKLLLPVVQVFVGVFIASVGASLSSLTMMFLGSIIAAFGARMRHE